MKRLNIIVNSEFAWRIQWKTLKRNPDDYNVLLVDKRSYQKIIATGMPDFIQDIFVLDDENFDHFKYGSLKFITGFNKKKLKAAILSIIQVFNAQETIKPYLLNIVTIDEDNMVHCCQIQHEILVSRFFEDIYLTKYILEMSQQEIRSVELFKNKEKMKIFLSVTLKEYIPKFIIYHQHFSDHATLRDQLEKANLTYPLFVKPIDTCNSRGVYTLLDDNDLMDWIHLTKNMDVIYEIDEYIQGTLYHCDSIIDDQGEIVHVFLSEYLTPCASSFLENSAFSGSLILQNDHPVYDMLATFNQRVIQALAPKNCVTHHEVFIDLLGKIKFLEIARRAPGGLVPEFYLHQFGINLREIDTQLRLGLISARQVRTRTKKQHFARLEFSENELDKAKLDEILRSFPTIHIVEIERYLDYEVLNESIEHHTIELILECKNHLTLKEFFDEIRHIKSNAHRLIHIKSPPL